MAERDPRRRAAGAGGGLIRAGFVLLVLLAVPAFLAPWITSHDPEDLIGIRGGRYLPPATRAHEVRTTDGRRHLALRVEDRGSEVWLEVKGQSVVLPRGEIVPAADGALTTPQFFALGTDRLGRDLWARLLYGGRISLLVGFLAALVAATLGLGVGAAAAALGGGVDRVLMRLTDAFLAFPRLFLVLALGALFGGGATLVVLVLGATSWMRIARLARADILAIKDQEFVLAARAAGAAPLPIVWNHMIRNALTSVTAESVLKVGNVILVEAALSYLGHGVELTKPTWGNMIRDAALDLGEAWWAPTLPGLAIVLTVLGFSLLGDGLRDLWHPRTVGNAADR